MRLLILVSVLCAFTAGCATTGKLEAQMQTRVGQNINDVINEKGPPAQSFKKPDGDTIYTWGYQGNMTGNAYRSLGGGTNFNMQSNYCNISYTAGPDGIIKMWHHEGNICKSR